MDGKKVIKILESHGWEVLRVNGSHYRLGKGPNRVTVPIHSHRDLGIRLLKAIEKQTKVKLS